MPLHHSKRIALLNSLNCISSNDLTSLEDLSDGKCLAHILSTTFSESPVDVAEKCELSLNSVTSPSGGVLENSESASLPSEKDETVNGESKTESAVVESADNSITEVIDICTISPVGANTKKICSQECIVETVKSPDVENVDKSILQRYKFIQKFIDERFNLKSEEIISYFKCIEENEFELAKVAAFILSEVVKHYIYINNDHLRTLAHLDIRIQEDLEECFHLFISERENISKENVERILSNHAKYKSRSPLKIPFATPRRNCASKYKVDFPTTPSNEEVFSNSPLKSFFESPVFRKEEILKKNKEIAKTQKYLIEEEFKSEELQLELKNTRKILEEKEIEIKKLKETMHKRGNKLQDCEDELKQLRTENKRWKKKYNDMEKRYEEEMSELKKENGFLCIEAKNGQGFSRYQNLDEKALLHELIHRDAVLAKKNETIQHYRLKQSTSFVGLDKMQNMLDALTEELNAGKQKLKELEIQAVKDREVYATKLSELKEAIKKEPESEYPECGENLGVIIEEENRILQLNLENAYKKIDELEKLQERVQPEQNYVPNSKNAFNRSILEILDLPQTPKCRKRISEKSDTSVLEILELPMTPKRKRNDSTKSKELNKFSVECDMLNNSKVSYTNSPSSVHSEVVPFTKNASEPPLEEYGSLWKNLDNSHLEIENTDSTACITELNKPENCDKLPNKDLNLCPKCNSIPNKNGYKWNAIDLESCRKLKQELDEKEEKIDKLKAKCETLQQKTEYLRAKCETFAKESEDYVKQIHERDTEIDDLKTKLVDTAKKCREAIIKYGLLKKRFLEEKVKLNQRETEIQRVNSMSSLGSQQNRYLECLKTVQKSREQSDFVMKKQLVAAQQEVIRLKNENGILQDRINMLQNEKQKKLKELNEAVKKLDNGNKALLIHRNESIHMKVVNTETVKHLVNPKPVSHTDSNADALRDLNNESTMSGALYRNGLSIDNFPSNDEDSFVNFTNVPHPEEQNKRLGGFNHTHLPDDKTRFQELCRRNSIVPPHLKSAYPAELNLNHSNSSFFVDLAESGTSKNSEQHHSKKRKHQEESDVQSNEVICSTPISKFKKLCTTPITGLMSFRRSLRNGIIKPKP